MVQLSMEIFYQPSSVRQQLMEVELRDQLCLFLKGSILFVLFSQKDQGIVSWIQETMLIEESDFCNYRENDPLPNY